MTAGLSVVVATRDRPDDVRDLLTSLAEADDGVRVIAEVILVDDASAVPLATPGSATVPVRVLRNPRRRGAAASRNVGAAAAAGAALAFLDDDCRVLPDWCEVVASQLAAGRPAVTGRILPFDHGLVSRARQYRYEQRYAGSPAGGRVCFLAGGNSVVDAKLFAAVGGFPELVTASDNALVGRLRGQGVEVWFDPAMRVLHRNSKGIRIAAREAWRSAAAAGAAGIVAESGSALRIAAAQPWRGDPAVAALNSGLQLLHSGRRMTVRPGIGRPAPAPADPALQITELVITEGRSGAEQVLVPALSLRVAPGEVLALTGPAVALAALRETLTGHRRPSYGSVEVAGQRHPAGRGRRRTGIVASTAAEPATAAAVVLDPTGHQGIEAAIRRLRTRAVPVLLLIDPADPDAAATLRLADRMMPLRRAPGDIATALARPPGEERQVRFSLDQLTERVTGTLQANGASAETARAVARVLVDGDRRGHHSHGVTLLPTYLHRVREGGIDPHAQPRWLPTEGAVKLLDGRGGFGQLAAELAAGTAAVEARRWGLAAVGVRHNNHVGMLAAYRQPFVDNQTIGLILNISGVSVAAPGAGGHPGQRCRVPGRPAPGRATVRGRSGHRRRRLRQDPDRRPAWSTHPRGLVAGPARPAEHRSPATGRRRRGTGLRRIQGPRHCDDCRGAGRHPRGRHDQSVGAQAARRAGSCDGQRAAVHRLRPGCLRQSADHRAGGTAAGVGAQRLPATTALAAAARAARAGRRRARRAGRGRRAGQAGGRTRLERRRMIDREVAVGIVGLGAAGRQHLDAIGRTPGVRAVAGVDPRVAVPDGLAAHRGTEELFADPEVELVALCVPPGPRAALAEQAAAAGKAVLLEKPVARSVAELDRILAATRSAGVAAAAMLQHRMRLPEAALAHPWGPQATGMVEVSRPRSDRHYQQADWRRSPEAAFGGVSAHLGVHYLDLACQLLGEVAQVQLAGVRQRSPGIDARVCGLVTFSSGASLTFAVTGEAHQRRERLAILDRDAELVLTDGWLTGQVGGRPLAAGSSGDVTDLRAEVYAELAAAIRDGGQPRRSSLAAARPVTVILSQIAETLTLAEPQPAPGGRRRRSLGMAR